MFKKSFIFICLLIILLNLSSFSNGFSVHNMTIYYNSDIPLKQFVKHITTDEITDVEITNSLILDYRDGNLITKKLGKVALIIHTEKNSHIINLEVLSPINNIEVPFKSLDLNLGELYRIPYTLAPTPEFKNEINQPLIWESSNPRIASVNKHGQISTMMPGLTTITAYTSDKSDRISFPLTIVNKGPLSIEKPINNNVLKVGESINLKAVIGSKDVTSAVRWKSDTPSIMTVDNMGHITALNDGKVTISAVGSTNTTQSSITFNVQSMISSVVLSKDYITTSSLGDQFSLNANIIPVNEDLEPNNKGIYYTSTNPSIASVDSNGIVTTKGYGIALITVHTNDSNHRDFCTVEVTGATKPTTKYYIPIEEIELFSYYSSAVIGERIPLTIDITPEEATNQSIKFSIDNGATDQIIFADSQYYFVPNKRGQTTITVTAKDKNRSEISIRVYSPIQNIDLLMSTEHMIGSKAKLYMGDKIPLETIIRGNPPYHSTDVLPYTLKYGVDDSRIAQLVYENNKPYLVGITRGETFVTVENIENRHLQKLNVVIKSPPAIATDWKTMIPVGKSYKPRLYFEDSMEQLNTTYLREVVNYSVNRIELSSRYFEEEIAYENELIKLLKSNPLATTDAFVSKHEDRLNQLKRYLKLSNNDYVDVTTKSLTSRNFQPLKVYKVEDGKFASSLPIKLSTTMTLKGTARKVQSSLIWDKFDSITVYDHQQSKLDENDLIKYYKLSQTTIEQLDYNKTNFLIGYINTFNMTKHTGFDESLMVSLIERSQSKQIPQTLINKLNAPLTRGNLLILLDDLMGTDIGVASNIAGLTYYDLVDPQLIEATSRLYQSKANNENFQPQTTISFNEFNEIINLLGLPTLNINTDDTMQTIDALSYLYQL